MCSVASSGKPALISLAKYNIYVSKLWFSPDLLHIYFGLGTFVRVGWCWDCCGIVNHTQLNIHQASKFIHLQINLVELHRLQLCELNIRILCIRNQILTWCPNGGRIFWREMIPLYEISHSEADEIGEPANDHSLYCQRGEGSHV